MDIFKTTKVFNEDLIQHDVTVVLNKEGNTYLFRGIIDNVLSNTIIIKLFKSISVEYIESYIDESGYLSSSINKVDYILELELDDIENGKAKLQIGV